MATTATARTVKKSRTVKPKRRFDGTESSHWHEIPSKGQLYGMAIAAFNGMKFPGSECFTREAAKAILTEAKEKGYLDEKK